jgi:hypothetical protein
MTLAGSTFRAVANSINGTLNTDTTMTFVSEDEWGILGVYGGGTIRTGSVVGSRKDPSTIEMLYHCVTTSGELKAGRRWRVLATTRTDDSVCTSTGSGSRATDRRELPSGSSKLHKRN